MTRADDPAGAVARIAQHYGLADISVFGSRAAEFTSGPDRPAPRGKGDADVDIAVRPAGSRQLTPEDRVELTLALERALAVSRVDLVVLQDAGAFLALAAIRGNLLFCADAVDQAQYELYVLRRAGDLAPFERERQRIVLNGGR
jgi:predicted nucleotidyltransferase